MLAVVILTIIVSASVYFFSTSEEDFLNNLQMVRTGGDIVAVLEKEGSLDTLSQSTIETKINELLPINYAMRLIINSTADASPFIIETERDIDERNFLTTGKRFFTFEKNNEVHTGSVKYEVWLK